MNMILLEGTSSGLFTDLIQNIGSFILRAIGLLPDSFVNEYLVDNNFEFLGFLNWFIPFYDFAYITSVWTGVMLIVFGSRVTLKVGDKVARLLK